MTFLIVRVPFGPYNKGDPIADPTAVAALIASEAAQYVIPIAETSGLDDFLAALGLLGPVAPPGFALLLGADGAQLTGADNAPLYGVA